MQLEIDRLLSPSYLFKPNNVKTTLTFEENAGKLFEARLEQLRLLEICGGRLSEERQQELTDVEVEITRLSKVKSRPVVTSNAV